MDSKKLKDILKQHKMWLTGKEGGKCADLRGANLRDADLYGADLRDADLCGANLRGSDLCNADLRDADLCDADLCGANLRGADLCDADLCGANLRGADLCNADLCDADLCNADLRGANLCDANLRDARNIELAQNLFDPICCPGKGAYIGWKKAGGMIVELEITDDALRSSATGRKCRASKARVLSITSVDGTKTVESIRSDYNKEFIYRVGETVEVDDFEMNRWNECAPGIHHYITREEAVRHI